MSALLATVVSALVPISAAPTYDRSNEQQFREQVMRESAKAYRKDGNIILPYGYTLGFTGSGKQVILGLDGSDQFTISIDGATAFALSTTASLTALEAAYQAADTTLQANITSEALTRASADTAISSTVTTLTATVASNHTDALAAVSTEATARATADSALATRTSALEATVDTPTTGLTARVTTAEAAIVSEGTARASADTAIIAAYQAADSTIAASVTSEASTRASADSALASRASALEATVDTPTTGLTARVTTAEAAIVTNTGAISSVASSVTSLTTTVSGKVTTFRQTNAPTATAIGDLWYDSDDNNKLYRAAATGSGNWVASDDGRIATLISDLDTAEATIVTNTADITTNATAISTLSGSVSSLSTTVSAHTTTLSGLSGDVTTLYASVSTNASAITAVDGKLTASYSVTVDGNGKIASLKLLSDGSTSTLAFTASTFKIFDDSSTNVSPFEISGGVVKIKTANVGVLVAANIGAGEITASKLSISTLSAISADLGTVTAGNLTADVITSGTLNVARISAGSITSSKLASGSIAAVGYENPTTGGITNGYVSKASKTITTDGGVVEIDFAAFFELDNPLLPEWSVGIDPANVQEITILATVKRGSTSILSDFVICSWVKFFDGVNGFFDVTQAQQQGRVVLTDEPSAGSYTYSVELKCSVDDAGTGNPAILLSGGNLFRVLNPIDGPNDVSPP